MLMDKKTPLRDADRIQTELQEKKRMAQITQANRMIRQQGRRSKNKAGVQVLLWLYRWITEWLVMLLE
jgi:hypothetical protein